MPAVSIVYDYNEWSNDLFTSGEIVHVAGKLFKCTPPKVCNSANACWLDNYACTKVRPNTSNSAQVWTVVQAGNTINFKYTPASPVIAYLRNGATE